MNRITFLEYNTDDSIRSFESDGLHFLENIEKFSYESFKNGEGNVRIFAFILNDNSNNYFSELLSNSQFVKEFTDLVKDKITVFWCEPEIDTDRITSRQFEYFVKIKGIQSTRLWSKLVTKIAQQPNSKINLDSQIFPGIFIMSVEKKGKEGRVTYPITDMYCISLLVGEHFENVNRFKDHFVLLFNDILRKIEDNKTKDGTKKKPLFSLEEIIKEIIKETIKLGIKSGYTDLGDLISDLLEN